MGGGAAVQAPTRTARIAARLLPSLADVLFLAALLGGVLVVGGRALGPDGDLGWNLRLGGEILAHGLPRTEPLLSTQVGQPAVHWEWLAQVFYALAYRLAGFGGVVALASATIALTAWWLLGILRARGLPLLAALALAICGLALLSITWTARAQLFSLPLTLWWAEWLWRYTRDGDVRWLWRLPPTMVLWANLHAGFIGGLLLLGAVLATTLLWPGQRGGARPRALLWALLASLAATLLTPWGPALWQHILAYARNPLIALGTQEYQSPDFHQPYALLWLALVALLVTAWVVAARRGHLPPPLAVAYVALWTVLALTAVRFVPLWALVCLPVLGEALLHAGAGVAGSVAWQRLAALATRIERTDARVGHGLWSGAAVLALVVVLAWSTGVGNASLAIRVGRQLFPVGAVERLRGTGLPPGRGFNTYTWGGYLDFALPEYHVFIDSRSDAYPPSLLRDYSTIVGLGPGWERLLDQYAVAWALLPTHEPLAQVLARTPGWHCAPADGDGVAVLCQRG